VIVVDNASFDGCGELLASEHPEVIFIQSQINLGFARANNLGAKKSRGKFLLFLNPDTEVRDRTLDRLFDHLSSLPGAGAVGCRLLNSDGSLQLSCVQSFPTIINQVLDAHVLRRIFPRAGLWGTAGLFEKCEAPVKVEAVSGACLMIRREVFDQVGGFSSDYFMYGEDLDLCFKTRRQGLDNYHCGEAVVVHHGGGSSRQAQSSFATIMIRKSVKRFLRKYHGRYYSGGYQMAMSGAALVRLAFLMALIPAFAVRGRTSSWLSSIHKWLAIFCWGLGLERWTGQYRQAEKNSLSRSQDLARSCADSVEN